MAAGDSIRELIMQNRLTRLETLKYDDVNTSRPFKVVSRNDGSAFTPNQLPAVYLSPGQESKRKVNNLFECELQLTIEIYVQLDNTNADAQLNTFLKHIFNAFSADISCANYAQTCYPLENSFVVGSSTPNGAPDRAVIVETWLVKYRHSATDATLKA